MTDNSLYLEQIRPFDRQEQLRQLNYKTKWTCEQLIEKKRTNKMLHPVCCEIKEILYKPVAAEFSLAQQEAGMCRTGNTVERAGQGGLLYVI